MWVADSSERVSSRVSRVKVLKVLILDQIYQPQSLQSQVINQSVYETLKNQSSTKRKNSDVSVTRRRISLARDIKVLPESPIQPLKYTVKVYDEAGNDVTPLPLYQKPGATKTKQVKKLKGHDITEGTISEILSRAYHTLRPSSAEHFTMSGIGSNFVSSSSHSTMRSLSDEIEEPSSKQDPMISQTELKIDTEQQIPEHLLDNPVDIHLTETENMCFLDIPSVSEFVESKEAETIMARNKAYTEMCMDRKKSDKYVEHAMQTFNPISKSKETQRDCIIMPEKGSMATSWEIYDLSMCSPGAKDSGSKTDEEKPSITDDSSAHCLESKRAGATSTVSACSTQRAVEVSKVETVKEPHSEKILQSEKFEQSLKVMERMILMNIYQQKQAAYRGLPLLPDPDCVPNLGEEDGVEINEVDSLSPSLEFLWAFSCELTKGHSVTCMTWNKKEPDILAVGYGQFDFKTQKCGLVCIWSLKNPAWPDRIFNCETSVTSLDFSASQPNLLAVSLYDGTIAIYNVQNAKSPCICDSSNCDKKHTAPVWQVKWISRKRSSEEDKTRETLCAVSADSRISEWFLQNSLNCSDVMKLKRIRNEKTEKSWRNEPLLSCWAVGMCFDFQSYDSNLYLVGTEEGHIHECSCLNDQFLETYTNHLGPVYKVAWSPFCPDVFLSCSADGTIQLWSQDYRSPVQTFTSIEEAVYDIMWSPHLSTVFGAIHKDRVEIWDLGASLQNPTFASEAIPGVKPTSLLFAMNTDCILVGNSEGQVSVYKLKNFTTEDSTEVDKLKNIVSSTLSSLL